MFRKALSLLLANTISRVAPPVIADDLEPVRRKGSGKFTSKASGAAALKRVAKKRNNIRKRKGK